MPGPRELNSMHTDGFPAHAPAAGSEMMHHDPAAYGGTIGHPGVPARLNRHAEALGDFGAPTRLRDRCEGTRRARSCGFSSPCRKSLNDGGVFPPTPTGFRQDALSTGRCASAVAAGCVRFVVDLKPDVHAPGDQATRRNGCRFRRLLRLRSWRRGTVPRPGSDPRQGPRRPPSFRPFVRLHCAT